MSRRTYYEILHVSRDADQREIKQAYRRLARRYHPDQNPHDPIAEEQFKELVHAYQVLSNPETRRRYDVFGTEKPVESLPSRPVRPGQFFNLIFSEVTRRVGDRLSRKRGEDLRIEVPLHFVQAARGCRRIIELPTVEYSHQTVVRRRFEFRIPAGVEDGQTLRWRGRGAPGFSGGQSGDFLMHIFVEKHPVFRRMGLDISMVLPLTEDEAERGGVIKIPTIRGIQKIKIPRGAQSGYTIRLRGKGVRKTDGRYGDQVLHIRLGSSEESPERWPRQAFKDTCTTVRKMTRGR